MTTVTASSAYPRNDIRSIFNTKSSSSSSESKSVVAVVVAPIKEKETKPPAKKVEKKTEIDHLCDAYCKIIKKGDVVDKDKVKDMLYRVVEQFKIRPKKLYRYFHYIKYNSGKKMVLTLELLLQTPFEFISFQNQFISYKDAMNICQENGTFPELRVRIVAWIYDYFIGKQNKYYISENDSEKLYTEFLSEFVKEKAQAEQILFGGEILIQMKFGQKIFYTTREFIDHEKMIGDMVLDLFHHDDDDDTENDENDENDHADDHEKIEEHIKLYIKKQNKDDFQFEPEQLEAIHKGCALKRGELFNITGPPGTGKSTIVNCIVNLSLIHI
jgi:ABC-type multidrug transport system fused ATPase/permease subunit